MKVRVLTLFSVFNVFQNKQPLDCNMLLICPNCKSVIEDESQSICLNYGAVLTVGNIENKRYPWALVYTTNTMIDAYMFKANLESAGIPTEILSQVDTTRMLTVGELALVKIYVPSPFYSVAKEIIESIETN